jgi:hypothetical protein
MRLYFLISIASGAIPRNGRPGDRVEQIANRLWQQKGYVMPTLRDAVSEKSASETGDTGGSQRRFHDDDGVEIAGQVTSAGTSQGSVSRSSEVSIRGVIRRVFDEDEGNMYLPLSELLPKLRLALPTGDFSNEKSLYAQVAKIRRERLGRRNRLTSTDTLEVVRSSTLDMTKEFLRTGDNRCRKNVDLFGPLAKFLSENGVRSLSRATLLGMLSAARGLLSGETGENWSVVCSKKIRTI